VQGGGREARKFSRELRDELILAVEIIAEYDVVYRNGESKRARAARLNRSSPEPEISDESIEYFDIFWQLSALRGETMSGTPIALQPGQIMDWCKLTRNDFEVWELELFLAMDKAYRTKISEMSELHREADKSRHKGYKTNGHSDDRI
jgi:hypothetical protein